MKDKRTERIIGIYTLVIALCGCFLVGFLLYDSHIKGIRGEAYDVRIQDDYLMFIADMSSSIKLDEIESVQFYNESVPEQDGIKIGTGTNEFLTGRTSLKGVGNCDVYVYKNKDYYIKLVTDDRVVVFNLWDKDEAMSLFDNLTLSQKLEQED